MAKKFKSPDEQYLKPDPRYGSKLLAKFINSVMWDGKKTVAQRVVYGALDAIHKKMPEKDPIEVFTTAVNNVKPLIEVRSKRVGGATYQVPVEVGRRRQQSLAFRWILQTTRGKKGKPMSEKLAVELLDAYNKTGAAVTIRMNIHKMAEANKAFAHFGWGRR